MTKKQTLPRPPGGNKFEAVQVAPEGWLIMAPWVQNTNGYWWRPHLNIRPEPGYGETAKEFCEYYANVINKAMGVD